MHDLCRILYSGSLIKLYQWVKMSRENKFNLIEVITNKARAEFTLNIPLFPLSPLLFKLLRWLDWIFLGGYLPSLSIDHVTMSKDREKRLPQLYYIKMKISYDLGFIAIGVAMAT